MPAKAVEPVVEKVPPAKKPTKRAAKKPASKKAGLLAAVEADVRAARATPAPKPAPSAEPQVAAESRHSSSSPYCHCDSKLTRRARPPASRAGAPGCWRCPPPAARRLSSRTRRAARSGLHEVVVAVCAQCEGCSEDREDA